MKRLDCYIKSFLLKRSFNNIDILLNNRAILKLDEVSLKNKLIDKNRGGYCFENNQYFYDFLKNKGYVTSRVLGRVTLDHDLKNRPRTHQLTIIDVNFEKYLVDVGFGPYTPSCAIPLSGAEVVCHNKRIFRVKKVDNVNYQLEILRDSGFSSLYQFDLNFYNNADFKLSNYYTNTHDDSKFTSSFMLSQQTKNGVIFINDLAFTKIERKVRTDQKINSEEELFQIISKFFTVKLSKEECIKLYGIIKSF